MGLLGGAALCSQRSGPRVETPGTLVGPKGSSRIPALRKLGESCRVCVTEGGPHGDSDCKHRASSQ